MNRLRSTLQLRRAIQFLGIQFAVIVLAASTLAAQWPDYYTCDIGAGDCRLWEPSVRQLLYAPSDSKCWCYLTYQQRECNGVTEFRVLSIEPVDYNAFECDSFRQAFESSGNPLRILGQKRMFQDAMRGITEVIAAQQWTAAHTPPGNPLAIERMRCPNGYVSVRGVSAYCMSTDLTIQQPQQLWYKITDSLVYVDEEGRIQRVYYFKNDALSEYRPTFGSQPAGGNLSIVIGGSSSIPIGSLPSNGNGFRFAPDGTQLVPVPSYRLTYTPCGGAACCKRETRICYENGYQQKVVQRFTIAPNNPPGTCQDAANDKCIPWCEESISIDAFTHAAP